MSNSLLALASICLVGCASDDPERAPPDEDVETPPPAVVPPSTPVTPTWGTCTFSLQGDSFQPECASVDMPARRDGGDNGTVPIAVYRFRAPKQPANGQLWVLNGGPGGSGMELAAYAELFAQTFVQGLDVYLVDHRGTGESTFLQCPEAERTAATMGEFGARCSAEIRAEHGALLDGFSTTEAAHDVRELIDATAAPGQKVFVYGVSYGSYWAHRLLQLPGLRVDAVVTEGNCFSSTCTFDRPQTFAMDEVMGIVLEACKADTECAARLGGDPPRFARDTLALLAEGHCAAAAFSHYRPADMVFAIGPYWPQGTLPVLARLNRCNDDDVTALNHFENLLAETGELAGAYARALPRLGPLPTPNERHSSSPILGLHVIASEMISRPAPSRAQLDAQAATLLFKPDADVGNEVYDAWQPYPRDAYVDGWMQRDVPWLVLQGDFDFQTVYSLSQAGLARVRDPSVQFVRVFGGNHSVVFDNNRCSLDMMQAFLANPTAPVDTSCVATLKANSVTLDPAYAQYFFGGGNGWD